MRLAIGGEPRAEGVLASPGVEVRRARGVGEVHGLLEGVLQIILQKIGQVSWSNEGLIRSGGALELPGIIVSGVFGSRNRRTVKICEGVVDATNQTVPTRIRAVLATVVRGDPSHRRFEAAVFDQVNRIGGADESQATGQDGHAHFGSCAHSVSFHFWLQLFGSSGSAPGQ